MSKMLCNCGSCRDAFRRAFKIAEQCFTDRECPAMMLGMGTGLTVIASALYAAGAKSELAELGSMAGLVAMAAMKGTTQGIQADMAEDLQSNEGQKEFLELMDQLINKAAVAKAEADLPKGK